MVARDRFIDSEVLMRMSTFSSFEWFGGAGFWRLHARRLCCVGA